MNNIQALFLSAGRAACFAFCIMRHAAFYNRIVYTYGEVFDAIILAGSKDLIQINLKDPNDPNNFFVGHADGRASAHEILSLFTKRTWALTRESADYKIGDVPRGTFVVARYELKTPSGTSGHFVNPKTTNQPYFDPLGKSNTVQNGSLVSFRVFTPR